MKVVFWLDPGSGIDASFPAIIGNLADGLSVAGYTVELHIKDPVLDAYPVEKAKKFVYYPEGNQQILTDILISNRLDQLLWSKQHRTGQRVWLALDEDLEPSIRLFEEYQLYQEVGVITLLEGSKDRLIEAGIEAHYIQPGLNLQKYKVVEGREGESRRMILSLGDPSPEILRPILKGIEMTQTALNQFHLQIFTTRPLNLQLPFPFDVFVHPTGDKRVAAYQKSDLILHLPGKERLSLIPLEAMASGLPVILLGETGQGSSFQHDENCLIVDKFSPKEVALSILNILKIGKIRSKIKGRGLKTIQNYDLQEGLDHLITFLKQMTPDPKIMEMTQVTDKEQELVDIVIVNYNSGEQMRHCLQSIQEHTPDDAIEYQILVVDNGSQDGSLENLRQNEKMNLIANQENMGFARAVNQGVLAGKGAYIVIMHSDVQVSSDWLQPLLREIQKEKVGLVYPQTSQTESELHDASVTDVENPKDEHGSKELNTGCFVIRRQLLNRVGLFDERYFMFYETQDYALRLKEKGYQINGVINSRIDHHWDLGELALSEVEERESWMKASRECYSRKWGQAISSEASSRQGDGILLFSLKPWEKRSQRTEAVMDYFTRQGLSIVYVEPYCSREPARVLGQGQYIYTPQGSGTILHALKNSGKRIELTQELKETLQDWKIHFPLLLLESPWWEPIMKHIEHGFSIYLTPELLLTEDLERYQELQDQYMPLEEKILRAADLVVVGTQKRVEELKQYREKTLYNPGGFYPTDLERFVKGHYTLPEDLVALPGNKVGIIGTFSRLFPAQLLKRLANENADTSFVFIGGISWDLGELGKLPNLHFLGSKDWENLLDYLYFLDLMIYPYSDQGLYGYLDPYMVNYFLALGKPIVAFAHQELVRFEPFVKIATDQDSFIEMTSNTLKQLSYEQSEERIRQRIRHIRGGSWEDQLNVLYQRVKDHIPVQEEAGVKISESELQEEQEQGFLTNIFRQFSEKYQRFFGRQEKD